MARVAASSEALPTPPMRAASRPARETLLIVACSARALAASAVRAGYRCVAVDHYGDLDLEALAPRHAPSGSPAVRCRARALVNAALRVPSDSVVYGASLENHPELVERLASGRALLGNPAPVLRAVRDVDRIAAAAREAGVAVPRTLGPGSEALAEPRRRWLRKRRASGGGVGITEWRPGLRLRRGEMLQSYVPGVAGSAVLVADGERCRLLGLTRQLVGDAAFGADGFRYCGSLLPFSQRERDLAAAATQVRRAAAALVAAYGVRGLFGIDFVLRAGAVHLIEVNPRYTASMELLERAYGLPLFEWHVAGCRATLPDPLRLPSRRGVACGKAILFARRRVTLGDTRPWLSLGARDVPRPNTTIPARGPICSVFAEAKTLRECERALRREALQWRARIEPGRERRHAS